jgi:hypothetical protein
MRPDQLNRHLLASDQSVSRSLAAQVFHRGGSFSHYSEIFEESPEVEKDS